MLADLLLVAAKDLRAEMRSLVGVNQVAPFAALVLVLFGFALDADTSTLATFTPGLFWIAVVLAALLAVHRSVELEAGDGANEGLLLSGLRAGSVFLGKALALVVELLVIATVMLFAVLVLYEAPVDDVPLLVVTIVAAVVGIAAAGTLYGALLSGQRMRETVLPLLLLPVLAPVVIGAARAFGDAMGTVATDGWAWLGVLVGFALTYAVIGTLFHGTILEEVG